MNIELKPQHTKILDRLIRSEFDRYVYSWQSEMRDDLIALAAQLDRTELVTEMCNDL